MQFQFKMPEQRRQMAAFRYSRTAMLFHWSIATLVLFEFGSALSFSRFDPGHIGYFRAAYGLHMSAGMALLALSLSSSVWRLSHTCPPLPHDVHRAMRSLAKIVLSLLRVFILVVPLIGWAILSARNAHVRILGNLHWPNITYFSHMTYEHRFSFNDFLLELHAKLSYLGMSLVALHVAASLYHHFYRGDEVLLRMLPRIKTRTTYR
jgi:cytochrome b561